MKLIHRFAYYFGGFTMGLIILFFFLNNKNASCAYFPDARVLKNIRTTPDIIYSPEALEEIKKINFDTVQTAEILVNGDVDFSRSIVHSPDTCSTYLVTGNRQNEGIELFIENCDSIATILSVRFNPEN